MDRVDASKRPAAAATSAPNALQIRAPGTQQSIVRYTALIGSGRLETPGSGTAQDRRRRGHCCSASAPRAQRPGHSAWRLLLLTGDLVASLQSGLKLQKAPRVCSDRGGSLPRRHVRQSGKAARYSIFSHFG